MTIETRGIALPHLRAWRQRKGLSQRELGTLAGVQYSQISRIERQGQHVTPTTIKRLAEALGVSRETLIGGMPGDESAATSHPTRPRRAMTPKSTPAETA